MDIKLLSVKQLNKSIGDLKTKRLQITLSVAYHALVFGNVQPLEVLGAKELNVLSSEKQFIPATYKKDAGWTYDKKKAMKVFEIFNTDPDNPRLVWNDTKWEHFVTALTTYVKPTADDLSEEEQRAADAAAIKAKSKSYVAAMKKLGLNRQQMLKMVEDMFAETK